MANKDKPWLDNKQWRRGVLRSYLKIYVIIMVSFSFILNSIVVTTQVPYCGQMNFIPLHIVVEALQWGYLLIFNTHSSHLNHYI